MNTRMISFNRVRKYTFYCYFMLAFVCSPFLRAQSCMYNNASTTTDLINARYMGYTEMIVALWSVQANGDITWGSNVICSNGTYTMDNYVEQYAKNMNEMKTAPGSSIRRIEVGLGGWGNTSYDNIRNLINSQGIGAGSILYRNFAALKSAIPAIDAVNNDDEYTYDLNTTVQFGVMLANIGFKYTLAPYMNASFWQNVISQVNAQRPNQIDRLYLQMYAGGRGNSPCNWHFGGVPVWAGYYDVEDSYSHIQSDLPYQKNNCGVVGGFMWFDWGNDKRNYSDIINPVFGVTVPARISASTGLVTTYVEFNGQGYSAGFAIGDYNIGDIMATGMPNDAISCIRIPQGIKVTLYADANFSGTSIDLTSGVEVFSSQWNNQVSSMRVRANGDPNLGGQTFILRNHNSNLYMDVPNASTADGVQLQQWNLNESNAQRFTFTHLGDGMYTIQNVNSGKVIDVDGFKSDNGTKIQQWTSAGGINQKFIACKMTDGSYKFIIPYNGKVMDMPGWPTNAGGLIAEYDNFSLDGMYSGMWWLEPSPTPNTGIVTAYTDPNGGGYYTGFGVGNYTLADMKAKGFPDNLMSCIRMLQGFKVILYADDNFSGSSVELTSNVEVFSSQWDNTVSSMKVLPNGDPGLDGKIFYLQNRNSGLYVDVWGAGTADGTNIAQGTYNGGTNQQFQLTHLGDGAYKVLTMINQKSVDVSAISTADGANVQEWTYFGSANQKFVVYPTGDGYYKLIPTHSGKVIEVAGASTANAANIQQWTNNNQTCGQWKFKPYTTAGTGTGLTGNYCNGLNFEKPVYNRVDANVNFNWGTGSPNAAVNSDTFSVRWTGQVQPLYTDTYTFYLNTDNGRRLWVNGQLIIDKWLNDWGTVYSGTIALTAGQKYDIRVDYFEAYGGASAVMEWSSFYQDREIVPQTQLYPNTLPTISLSAPANNAVFTAPATVGITATAADGDGSVAKVDFYNGTTLLGTDASAPFTYNWTGVASGTYTITALATDNRGGFTLSSAITVIVNQPPTVSITAPANNATYVAAATVNFTATAADADGSVTKVDYYNGSTLIGTATTSPYNFSWTNVAAGTYTITAKATDNRGAVTTSSAITVIVNQLPTVSITSPANNATYVASTTVNFTASATDADGSVTKVDYYNGITLIGTATTSPYSFSWMNVGIGTYTITAKATDNLGGVTTSSAITVVVNANQLPTVTITAPANNATYTAPASVSITATASDADGSITKVDFYNGAVLLGTVNSFPYTYSWTGVAAGTYTLTARATDDKSGVTTSSAITIVVSNPNQAPTVSIISPLNNSMADAPATVSISAESSDVDGTIVKVEFFSGSVKLETSTASPYTFTWSNIPAGTYTLTAVATDDQGATTTSDPVTLIVTVATGIDQGQGADALILYPNPASHSVSVIIPTAYHDAQYRIIDMKGEEVIPIQTIREELDITDLSAGVYSVIITKAEEVIVKKLVVR